MTAMPRFDSEQAADEHAVDAFAVMMKAKLAASRNKGRSGWYDPARCTLESLDQLFVEHLGKTNAGNYIDLATIAMMIHIRAAWTGERIAVEAPDSDAPPQEGAWEWWAGSDGEVFTVGPCETRDQALREAVADGLGEQLGGDLIIHLCEARRDPLWIADWITSGDLIELAEDAIQESDRVNGEVEDVIFEVAPDHAEDLKIRIQTACDEWQIAHRLTFIAKTFSKQRAAEAVTIPGPAPAGSA